MIRFNPPQPPGQEASSTRVDERASRASSWRARSGRRARALLAHPVAIAALVTILLAATLFGVPLCSDVTWQLWIAHHIRTGARLYVDIVEVNPPLWYWMAVPVDAIAEALGIEPGRVLIPVLALAAIASLAATERLVAHIPVARRSALLVYAALAMLVLPTWMTGQKEQLLLIASLPYIALAAARREGRPAPVLLAIGIGVGAALGFALKHYFLITPLLLELFVALGLRRAWRPLRPETVAVAITGAGYIAAILVETPDFLTHIVPLVRLTYDQMGSKHLLDLLQAPQYIWLGSLVVLGIHHRSIGRRTPFTAALLVATLGFAIAWAIQHKGWAYQGIATSAGLAIAIAALLAETGRRLTPLAPAVLIAPILLGWYGDGAVDGYRKILAPFAAETRPGETVGVISTDPDVGWPLMSEQRLRFPSRYYSYWMLNAVVRHEHGDHDPRLAALGRSVVANTVLDYRCMPPRHILFTHLPTGPEFDIYAFFLRDPAFRALMRHYRRESWTGGMDVFRQVSALPPIRGSACRQGV